MKRRKFIKTTALSMSSLVLLSTTACDGDDNTIAPIATDKRILIIGAGIAGLSAAKYFKDRGVEVIIIESQGKVGGRLKTNRSLGVPFDEGASWIHGPNGNPITGIAKEARADTFVTDDDKVIVYDIDGSAYSDDVITAAEEKYESLLKTLNGDINKSFEEVFYSQYPQYLNDRLWTYQLSAYLEFDTGGDIGELSSLDFDDDENYGGADVIITNGYDKVAEYLAEGLDIRLDTKVTNIDYSETLTKVTTAGGEVYEADIVLITVPLGVLKQNIISFTPSLPSAISQAISKLKMGTINKYLCIWDTPFWNTELQYVGYSSKTKGKFNYFINVKKFANANALMTFTFGDYSELAEQMSDDEIITEIVANLRSIYGNDVPQPTNMLRTRWLADEHTFGAYSFASNGTRSSDFAAFENSVNNKLFFAGEHTSKDYRGTVHGAYLSGIREAEKMVKVL